MSLRGFVAFSILLCFCGALPIGVVSLARAPVRRAVLLSRTSFNQTLDHIG